ncbi:odorant-binding protein 2b-like isoform X3 [Sturnira hondurensis]|uniref:odorant-binding protein 2b-like isoform X3 n=1 Tax=Sturnira hondurensis TaxID=192404 RepID=UPI00187AFF4B|nr:odorant-binding protein 2b-like isoform X3 [Sturnira hondurensis]XP_036892711.1 odorant-binding protein 2b-like isoform X3 [Sturnira hondurensis]
MKVLVLTVLCGLITALQALDPLSLALEGLDITGTWYVKAMVADKGLPKEKRPKAVAPIRLDVLDRGYLEASFTFLKKGQCHEMKVVMHSTEELGKFGLSGDNGSVYLTPLPVKDHCVLYYEGQSHGRRFRMGKLLGRSPDANPEALEAFQKFTQSKGLPLEDISLPTQTESCVPESD